MQKPIVCVHQLVGKSKTAKIDPGQFDSIHKHSWHIRRGRRTTYAVRKVKRGRRIFLIQMHRQIAETPRGMVCHHINGNGLDNRLCNLYNCTKTEHRYLHSGRLLCRWVR